MSKLDCNRADYALSSDSDEPAGVRESRQLATQSANSMPFFTLPQVAENVAATTVIRWFRRPGDRFAAGEPLLELEAEETLIVVEAAEAGTLAQILVEAGRTVAIGEKVARVELTADARDAGGRHQPSTEDEMPDTPALAGGDVVPILMPQAGNTMEEGTVVSWLVKQGDAIAAGQTICEIETDKATIDFESPAPGRLARIVAEVGEPIAVKQPIALLADNDADADAYLAGEAMTHATASTGARGGARVVSTSNGGAVANAGTIGARRDSPQTSSTAGRLKASPAARKIAAERGVSLAAVGTGTGPSGRIISTDVEHVPATGASTVPRPQAAGAAATGSRRPMSKMRRAIGRNLQVSKQTIPHFYVRLTIDADPLVAFHREQKLHTDCTLNDVIVLAVGRAIGEFPAVRSQIAGDDLVEFPHANVGIAVGMDEGLVVPVLLAVDTLSLAQLAAETKRIVENARRGRLENIGQGNFTISNLGMFGVEEFSAIINPPESGILAVSAIREAVVVENGAMRAGRTMTMTLSADHRLVDGVVAAKFMARLKEILENPARELT